MTDQDETNEGATPEEVPRPDVTVPEPTSPGDAPPPAGEVAGAEAVPPSAVAPPAEDVAAHEEASAPPPASPLPASPPAAKRVAARATARKASPATSTKKGAAGLVAPVVVPPVRPTTLSIDIGGTGLKASVLDAVGKLVADRVRVTTPYPCPPKVLIDSLATLTAPLPAYDRVSAGFPGVVRKGIILTAPHFVTRNGRPEEQVVHKLMTAWTGFDLGSALEERFGRPVRLANDADLQGLDVVSGSGLEFVVTLGTGVGTALFLDGRLAPHLELAHHPFRKDQTYDEQLGDVTLRRIGVKKWRKRLEEAIDNFYGLLHYDKLYLGGGNSRLLVGHLDPSVTIVDNLAGILGGIKLWELPEA
jgi:polyphosphate glucokinase